VLIDVFQDDGKPRPPTVPSLAAARRRG
jgi:hypothetical protein